MNLRLAALLPALALAACVDVPEPYVAPVLQEAEPAAVAAPEPEPAPTPAPIRTQTFEITLGEGKRTQGGWIRGAVPDGTKTATLGDTTLVFDLDGNFFAAFDRDAPGLVVINAVHELGFEIQQPIQITPRDWDIEHVNVARRPSGSSEEWWAKREPEWLAIKAAREQATGAQGWRQDFVWPVTGRISGRFGRQRIYRGEPGSYHSGLDIAAPTGTGFVAPADGVVVLARNGFSMEGGIIILDHGAGLNSAFIHLSRLDVAEGDRVTQGQRLGAVGSTGRSTGPHLHWSLVWQDSRLDPLLFLPPMP